MYIEEAKEEHVQKIIELWKELMDYHKNLDSFFTRRSDGHINYEKHLRECISSEKSHVLIAIENDDVVGLLLGCIQNHPPVFEIDEYGIIHDMFIKEEFRRKKMAEGLVKKLVDWFHSKNIHRIELHCSAKNPISYRFWKNQGFEEYTYLMYLKD